MKIIHRKDPPYKVRSAISGSGLPMLIQVDSKKRTLFLGEHYVGFELAHVTSILIKDGDRMKNLGSLPSCWMVI